MHGTPLGGPQRNRMALRQVPMQAGCGSRKGLEIELALSLALAVFCQQQLI